MATYPLKNITIGGNTYQIQGGEFYVVEIETQNTSASTFAAFPSKSHIINDSTVTVYDKDGNVQSGFDFTKLLSAPCMAHIITHGSGGNIDSYAGLIGVANIQAPTYFSISFESDWKSPNSVNTRYGVMLDILQGSIDAVDGYALEVGGGGGSSLPVLAAMDGSSLPGNSTDFRYISANTSFYIWAKETSAVLMSLTDIMNLLQDGPVQMKDNSGYVTIGLRDSSTIWFLRPVDDYSPLKMIYCTYSSGTQKWTVSGVKNITLS